MTGREPDDLQTALRALAGRKRILVAVDFDGTVAPIVDDPDDARALPAAAAALARLAGLSGVEVALVSGRSLADLRRLAPALPEAELIGGHGAQPGWVEDGADGSRPAVDETALADVGAALQSIAARRPGTSVERKATSVVLHTRRAAREVARAAAQEVLTGPAGRPGVHVLRGKEVVELNLSAVTKGDALVVLRRRLDVEPGAVVYLGDDVTDEHAFAALDQDAGDVGVKVGAGDTVARHRVADPAAAATVLGLLADLRQAGQSSS